jgi:hypothetical protein
MVAGSGGEVQGKIDAARREAEAQFAAVVQWLTAPGDTRRLSDVEQGLWTLVLALGRALLALWFAHRRPRTVPRTVRGPDGRFYRWHGWRRTSAKTMFGEVSVERDFYTLGKGRHGETYVPLDDELGLQRSGFSLAAIGFALYLAAKTAFADATETLRRFWGWAPATKSVLQMVDQVAPLARPFLEAQPAPTDDGETIIVLVDGKGAPMITETEMKRRRQPHRKRPRGESKWRLRRKRHGPRRRRQKGDKSKNAKQATVGVIFTLRQTAAGIEGPIHKRVYATFHSSEALFIWLRNEADKRGYGHKRTIFLADGAKVLWKLQERYFDKAEPCLDWFHLAEKLWAVGATLYPEGSEELAVWVGQQSKDLLAGRTAEVIRRLEQLAATLPRSGPGTRGRRTRMERGIKYLKHNRHRMPYQSLRREGLPIGSGAVEGAVRQLIGLRLDGPGMRWSPARAEWVLHLRCVVLNGLWDEFMLHVAEHVHSRPLQAQRPPGLGSTHNAKLRKAA